MLSVPAALAAQRVRRIAARYEREKRLSARSIDPKVHTQKVAGSERAVVGCSSDFLSDISAGLCLDARSKQGH
jgi:hypothetical protein